jgi:hypothetical protein
MMRKLLQTTAIVGAVLALPLQASALTVTGFMANPVGPLFDGSTEQSNASAVAFEDYGNLTGSLTAGENLTLDFTTTVNPFLDALSGGGFSNTIDLAYQINSGPSVDIPVTQNNNTGSAFFSGISLMQDDVISFFISGTAGRSGNDVDFNIVATGTGPGPSEIPLPPTMIMGLSALAGVGLLKLRRKKV